MHMAVVRQEGCRRFAAFARRGLSLGLVIFVQRLGGGAPGQHGEIFLAEVEATTVGVAGLQRQRS